MSAEFLNQRYDNFTLDELHDKAVNEGNSLAEYLFMQGPKEFTEGDLSSAYDAGFENGLEMATRLQDED